MEASPHPCNPWTGLSQNRNHLSPLLIHSAHNLQNPSPQQTNEMWTMCSGPAPFAGLWLLKSTRSHLCCCWFGNPRCSRRCDCWPRLLGGNSWRWWACDSESLLWEPSRRSARRRPLPAAHTGSGSSTGPGTAGPSGETAGGWKKEKKKRKEFKQSLKFKYKQQVRPFRFIIHFRFPLNTGRWDTG